MITVLSNTYCHPCPWQHQHTTGRDHHWKHWPEKTLHVLYKCWNTKWHEIENRKNSNVLTWWFLFFGIKKKITIKKWPMFWVKLTVWHVRDSTNIPVGDITVENISITKDCTCCASVEIKSDMKWKQKEFKYGLLMMGLMMGPILFFGIKNNYD